MPRYIDADILPKLFDEEYKKTRKLIEDGETHLDNLAEGFSEAAHVVTSVALTTDVQEVRHGRWISNDLCWYKLAYYCSECSWVDEYAFNERHKYCPNCGAKMDCDEK